MSKNICPKRLGELAEVCLLLHAMTLGFSVSRPYGDSDPFDFIFYWPPTGRLTRIQVKSTRFPGPHHFIVDLRRRYKGAHQYSASNVDFILAYAVPRDAWYVIPIGEVTGARNFRLCPDFPGIRSWTAAYRDAWDLLK